jgi:hypothetical protein
VTSRKVNRSLGNGALDVALRSKSATTGNAALPAPAGRAADGHKKRAVSTINTTGREFVAMMKLVGCVNSSRVK